MALALAPMNAINGSKETILVDAHDPTATAGGYSTFYIEMLVESYKNVAGSLVYTDLLTVKNQGVFNDKFYVDLSAYIQGITEEHEFPVLVNPNSRFEIPLGIGYVGIRITLSSYGDGVLIDTVQDSFTVVEGGPCVNEAVQGSKFFTHSPAQKLTTRYFPEYLYFMPLLNENIRLRYRATYLDGTQSAIVDRSLITGGSYELYGFPVGYQVLSLGSQPNTVVSWTVWIANEAGDPRSEEKTFMIDCYDSELRGRYFNFLNSFGVWDSVYFKGVEVADIESSSDLVSTAEFFVPGNTKYQELSYHNTRYYDAYEIASGYMPGGHAAFFRDLLISERVFRVNLDDPKIFGDQLQPVLIDRGATRIREDENDLDAIIMRYREANNRRTL